MFAALRKPDKQRVGDVMMFFIEKKAIARNI
jgi:hypothetical protein